MHSPSSLQSITIIIPTYNEQTGITALIQYLQNDPSFDCVEKIIVVDGGSEDDTRTVARKAGAQVILSQLKGRAPQMNLGANHAQSEILYFLHADTFPPRGFGMAIKSSIQSGTIAGCFRLKFNPPHWFLNFNCWFTRFNINAFRFGDQSLFVATAAFQRISGFNPKSILLEDQEIIKRLRNIGPFKVLDQTVITSARRYERNGVFKLQAIYYFLYGLYRMGASQSFLLRKYRQWIKSPGTNASHSDKKSYQNEST